MFSPHFQVSDCIYKHGCYKQSAIVDSAWSKFLKVAKDPSEHSWPSGPTRGDPEGLVCKPGPRRGKHLQTISWECHGICQWQLFEVLQWHPPLEVRQVQLLSAGGRQVCERCWGFGKSWGCSWLQQGWWQVYVQVLKVHKVWQEGILTSACRRLDYSLKIHLLSSWW